MHTAAVSTDTPACYHCGEPVPQGTSYSVKIGTQQQPMCCPGCSAVAQLIANSGLDNFYRQRTAFNKRPDLKESESAAHYAVYNEPGVNQSFTDCDASGYTHARLLLGGITCAACTWLIEQTLLQLPGVKTAVVNLAQGRLDTSFDPQLICLGEIFQRVDKLGYRARPFQTSSAREQMAEEYKAALRQLAVAGLGMMQVGMFAIALHAGDIQGMEVEYRNLLRWVSLLVASFVVVYSARVFFSSAVRHLKAGALVMDLPVSLAIGTAALASLWATVTGQGEVYFDSVVMFTFFLLLGRFLERRSRQRDQMAWFDAESSLPIAVKVMRDGHWQDIARQLIAPDEVILIPQGETVPVDAVVSSGNSSIDESTFNGEHLPRAVTEGDVVYAGAVNVECALHARVLGTFAQTRLAALQRSVESAPGEKPAMAALADRVASRFVAFILLVTIATAILWFFVDPSRVLWVCLSVLVISCPCALALATPAALSGAANGLRREGVIVRGENALDALSRSTHIVFDKTGTLTQGQLHLSQTRLLSECSEDEVLSIAASLQVYSNHPLASAFSQIPATRDFENVSYHISEGLEGRTQDDIYRIGSRAFCAHTTPDLPPPPDQNLYWIALCRNNTALAWFGLGDKIRTEAATVVVKAQRSGLVVEILTGDSSPQGPALAAALGIETVHTGLSPQQKMAYVQQLQSAGAVVTMVGDGLNDAPVLGVADASFAVANATELARTQADFVVLEGDLNAIIHTRERSLLCRKIIRQNLGWALGYNLCGIPLAALGFVPPWMAAIGMSASSLLVVLNSLRLNTSPRPR